MDKPSTRKARPAIVVHGGAWATPEGEHDDHRRGVHRASMIGFEHLLTGGSALDAVQKAVEYMESDEAFNAGRGSVLNARGEVSIDAAIMSGENLAAGSIAGVSGIVHGVSLARDILEHCPHVMLIGNGALDYARSRGLPTCDPKDLIVAREQKRYEEAVKSRKPGDTRALGMEQEPSDTVGAVACDAKGRLAAATSTGGALLKLPGRVGDSPLIGCGLYADDRRGAASSTGWGEGIMRIVMAHRAVEAMTAVGPAEAAQQAIQVLESRTGGKGGIIVVDPKGELGYAFNTPHMAFAYLHEGMTDPEVGI